MVPAERRGAVEAWSVRRHRVFAGLASAVPSSVIEG